MLQNDISPLKIVVLVFCFIALGLVSTAQTPGTGLRILDGVNYAQTDQGLRDALGSLSNNEGSGEIDIPSSVTLNNHTDITISVRIKCLGGPGHNVLNYIPSTGTALNFMLPAGSFIIEGCWLKTTTASSSTGIQLNACQECAIRDTHVMGFTGGIRLTGNGVPPPNYGGPSPNNSINSVGVRIDDVLIDGFCGSSSYGLSIDHTVDMTLDHSHIYTTNDCATAEGVIIDQGAEGLWLSHFTMEQGLHAMVLQARG